MFASANKLLVKTDVNFCVLSEMANIAEEKLREAACIGDLEALQTLISQNVNLNSQNSVNGWQVITLLQLNQKLMIFLVGLLYIGLVNEEMSK